MSNRLHNYANAQSSKKEDRLFTIFAYLNTQKDFNPYHIKQRVEVSDKTILGLLKEIHKAQMTTQEYQTRLQHPFEESESYKNAQNDAQRNVAQREYEKWQKQVNVVSDLSNNEKQILLPYVFDESSKLSIDEFYNRLETSILFYTFITTRSR